MPAEAMAPIFFPRWAVYSAGASSSFMSAGRAAAPSFSSRTNSWRPCAKNTKEPIKSWERITVALCCWLPGPPQAIGGAARGRSTQMRERGSSGLLGLGAAATGGAAARGHLMRCRSSTMSPHRLRRGALHLPARRSRQSAPVIPSQALRPGPTAETAWAWRDRSGAILRPFPAAGPTRSARARGRPALSCRGRSPASTGGAAPRQPLRRLS